MQHALCFAAFSTRTIHHSVIGRVTAHGQRQLNLEPTRNRSRVSMSDNAQSKLRSSFYSFIRVRGKRGQRYHVQAQGAAAIAASGQQLRAKLRRRPTTCDLKLFSLHHQLTSLCLYLRIANDPKVAWESKSHGSLPQWNSQASTSFTGSDCDVSPLLPHEFYIVVKKRGIVVFFFNGIALYRWP